jgi:4-hydroxy-2-oxoheptanedioate aldolase
LTGAREVVASSAPVASDDGLPPTRSRIGGWSIMGDRVGVEAICRSGVDFVGIDAQHGFFGFDNAVVAVQVANLCALHCLVRVPADQLGWVPRFLDAGANGVIIAMVNSPDQALEAVRLTLYQPEGQRSYGGGPRNGVGQALGQSPVAEIPEVFAMVETTAALERLDELAKVPGLTGLYVGPVDLGLAMARPYPLSSDDGPWGAAVAAVVEACNGLGMRAGMFATSGDDARRWLSAGFTDIVLSSDIAILRRSLHEHLTRAREPVGSTDPVAAPSFPDPYAGR